MGSTESFGAGNRAAYAVRTDMEGSLLWSRTYGGPGDWDANSAVLTEDGGAILVGATSLGNGQSFILRIDENGDTLWTRLSDPNERHSAMTISAAGPDRFLLVGNAVNTGGWGPAMEITCVDQEGAVLWNKTDTVSIMSDAFSVQALADGGAIISGRLNTIACLVRIDDVGAIQWSRLYYQQNLSNKAYCVKQTPDGGFAFSGDTDLHTWLVRTDELGGMLWQHTYGPSLKDRNQFVVTGQGDFAIGGEGVGANGYGMRLIRTDASGQVDCSETPAIAVDTLVLSFADKPLPLLSGCTVTSPATLVGTGAVVVTSCAQLNTIELDSPANVELFPDPAIDRICIRGCERATDVRVVDLAGRMPLNNVTLIDGTCLFVGGLKPGAYLLRWRSAERIRTARFSKL